MAKLTFRNLTQAVRAALTKAKVSPEDFNNMKESTQNALVNMYSSGRDSASRFSGGPEPDQLRPGEENLGGIADVASFFEQNAKVVTSAFREMGKAGMIFAADPNFKSSMTEAERSLNKITGIAKLGSQAFRQLSENVQQFRLFSDKAFESNGKFSTSLAEQAGMLKQLGMSYGTFTQNVDLAINSLGMNEEGVKKFNASIKFLADDLNMLPEQVSRNFQQVARNLMYDSTTIRQEFVKLQTLGQKTGLTTGQLMGTFGSSMDTIGGASTAAANLNALLGSNQFSATELLMMTEGDRAETIRQRMMDNPDLMRDIKAGGVEGKFALISAAEAMRMDRDEARRFLMTGERGSVKEKKEDILEGRFGEGSVQIKKFTDQTKSATELLAQLNKQFDLLQSEERLPFLIARRQNIDEIERGSEGIMSKNLRRGARLASIGVLPGTITQAQYDAIAIQQPGAITGLREVIKMAQMGAGPANLEELIQGAAAGGEEELKTLSAFRASEGDTIQKIFKDKKISEMQASAISRIMKTSPFLGRILLSTVSGETDEKKRQAMIEQVAGKRDVTTGEFDLQTAMGETGAIGKYNEAVKALRDATNTQDEDKISAAEQKLQNVLNDMGFGAAAKQVSQASMDRAAARDNRRRNTEERAITPGQNAGQGSPTRGTILDKGAGGLTGESTIRHVVEFPNGAPPGTRINVSGKTIEAQVNENTAKINRILETP